MALLKIPAGLNLRLILLHTLACWFFFYAFSVLYYLHDLKFYEAILKIGKRNDYGVIFKEYRSFFKGYNSNKIAMEALWYKLSCDIGLLTGLALSLLVSPKAHRYWLNSLLVLLIACFLVGDILSPWQYLKVIFLAPGRPFKSSLGYLLTNGFILLMIGVSLFAMSRSVKLMKRSPALNDADHHPQKTPEA